MFFILEFILQILDKGDVVFAAIAQKE